MTVNGLLQAICDVLGRKAKPIHADPRPGDILHSTADIEKAKRLIGFEPKVPFMEGLTETIAWYKQRR